MHKRNIFIVGKKNKLRIYFLSYLKAKILKKGDETLDKTMKRGFTSVGDLEGCIYYRIGTVIIVILFLCYIVTYNFLFFYLVRYEQIKFLCVALRNSIEIYAWAPKPFHKFMIFKVNSRADRYCLCHNNTIFCS